MARVLFLLAAAVAVLPAAAQAQARLEAEAAELFGATVGTTRPGFSGTGYATGIDVPTDSVRFTVQATGGYVAIQVAAASAVRVRSYTVWIDGEPITGSFILSAAFQTRTLVERRLSAGSHTITIQANADLDYLTLVPVVNPPPAAPPPVLADADATPAARSLFAFLRDEYGRHVLSGQHDVAGGTPRLSEIPYVVSRTGREPAIGSFDLIDWSPTRVACGTRTAGWAQRWIDWSRPNAAGKEGIVTLMWHWNAPTDLYDTDCNGPDEAGTNRNWYSGFYTEATSFNFAAALDPQSPNHALLLRDIDAVAVPIRAFRDAGVPVLWRPLHEAAGGFFWWGAQSGADYVQLWRLVYDRLVTHHGLHNMVWVWTYEPPQNGETALQWYPGDEYVDVVSRDFYSSNPETLIESEWDVIQARFAGQKLVALSESGTLPDMQDSADRGIWWNWFNIWEGGFIRNMDPGRLARIYNSDVVLTRDELPDWRSYSLPSAGEADPEASAARVVLFPNPSPSGQAAVALTLEAAADVRVEVYDLTGRLVQSHALGQQTEGRVEVPLDLGGAAGTYLVRVVAGAEVTHGRLTVVR